MQPAADFTLRGAYRAGLLTNMSNPKTLGFVASLFTTGAILTIFSFEVVSSGFFD